VQAETTDCCTGVPDTDGASCTSPPITAKANMAIAAIIMCLPQQNEASYIKTTIN
jgi:hypothetical protein